MAIFWPTAGFKWGEKLWSFCVLSRWELNFCTCGTQLQWSSKGNAFKNNNKTQHHLPPLQSQSHPSHIQSQQSFASTSQWKMLLKNKMMETCGEGCRCWKEKQILKWKTNLYPIYHNTRPVSHQDSDYPHDSATEATTHTTSDWILICNAQSTMKIIPGEKQSSNRK